MTSKIPSDRNFGLWFALIAAVAGLLPVVRTRSLDGIRWPWLAVFAGFLLSAIFLPRILRPLNLVWYRFGILLGRIVNPVVMGVIFFAVVTPIGFLKVRLLGRDPLHRKFEPALDTYWISRTTQPESMARQF